MFKLDGKEYSVKKLGLMLGVALGFFVMVYVVTPSCVDDHSHSDSHSHSETVTSSSSSSSSDGVGGHGAGSVCVDDGSNGSGGSGGNCESSVVNESL